MKTFTKVMLFLAGIFATIGVVCMVVAFCMGFSANDFVKMLQDGDFSIRIEDGEVQIFGINDSLILEVGDGFEKNEVDGMDPSTETEEGATSIYEIEEVCQNMDIEFGAGILEVYYEDVEHIVVKATNVEDISVGVKNETLKIGFSGNADIDVDEAEDRRLVVIIPFQMQFEMVDMEIGASKAYIGGLIADEVSISVGAGQATVEQLSVNKLDVEAGLGEVNISLNGAQEEYNYEVECGIGSVKVGEATYGGFAAEQSVTHDGAVKEIKVECGVGAVTILFQDII